MCCIVHSGREGWLVKILFLNKPPKKMKRLWIVWSNSIVELAQFHRRLPVTLLQRNKQLACNPFYKMCHQQISCWSKIAWLFPLGQGRVRYITWNFYSYSNSKRHWRWFCGLWKKSWLPTWSGLWGQICQPPCVLTGWGWSKPNLRGRKRQKQ